MKPYFEADGVTLYLGDCREVVPALGLRADLIVTDPPYASTSLVWDRWPEGWTAIASSVASSMWCFGSLRMFMERADDFAGWTCSQDLVWEKHNGSSLHVDRFRRVHEQAVHFYRGVWSEIHRETLYAPDARVTRAKTARRPTQLGSLERPAYVTTTGGPKLVTSVMRAKSMHGKALHPTEKPTSILEPLIRYGCPAGGLVVDLFAGSGSTLDAARHAGRRAIGIEAREEYAERAARRLSQTRLFGGAA